MTLQYFDRAHHGLERSSNVFISVRDDDVVGALLFQFVFIVTLRRVKPTPTVARGQELRITTLMYHFMRRCSLGVAIV